MIERIVKARKNVSLKTRIDIYELEKDEIAIIGFNNLKEYKTIMSLHHVIGPATNEELSIWKKQFLPIIPSNIDNFDQTIVKEVTNIKPVKPIVPVKVEEVKPIVPVKIEKVEAEEPIHVSGISVCPVCGRRKAKSRTYCKKCSEKLEDSKE